MESEATTRRRRGHPDEKVIAEELRASPPDARVAGPEPCSRTTSTEYGASCATHSLTLPSNFAEALRRAPELLDVPRPRADLPQRRAAAQREALMETIGPARARPERAWRPRPGLLDRSAGWTTTGQGAERTSAADTEPSSTRRSWPVCARAQQQAAVGARDLGEYGGGSPLTRVASTRTSSGSDVRRRGRAGANRKTPATTSSASEDVGDGGLAESVSASSARSLPSGSPHDFLRRTWSAFRRQRRGSKSVIAPSASWWLLRRHQEPGGGRPKGGARRERPAPAREGWIAVTCSVIASRALTRLRSRPSRPEQSPSGVTQPSGVPLLAPTTRTAWTAVASERLGGVGNGRVLGDRQTPGVMKSRTSASSRSSARASGSEFVRCSVAESRYYVMCRSCLPDGAAGIEQEAF